MAQTVNNSGKENQKSTEPPWKAAAEPAGGNWAWDKQQEASGLYQAGWYRLTQHAEGCVESRQHTTAFESSLGLMRGSWAQAHPARLCSCWYKYPCPHGNLTNRSRTGDRVKRTGSSLKANPRVVPCQGQKKKGAEAAGKMPSARKV